MLPFLFSLLLVPTPLQDEGASQLLERAVAAQFPNGKQQRVHGFRMLLNLRERSEVRQEFDLLHLYRAAGPGGVALIRSRLDDTDRGTQIQKGFDGKRYWLADGTGEVQWLEGREFTLDREAIDDSLQLTEDLLLLLHLDALRLRATRLALLPDCPEGRVGVGGVLKREDRVWRFALELHADTLRPAELRLIPRVEAQETDPPPSIRFVLDMHGVMEGLQFPRRIQQFVNDQTQPIRILEIKRFEWRRPPTRASFSPEPTPDLDQRR